MRVFSKLSSWIVADSRKSKGRQWARNLHMKFQYFASILRSKLQKKHCRFNNKNNNLHRLFSTVFRCFWEPTVFIWLRCMRCRSIPQICVAKYFADTKLGPRSTPRILSLNVSITKRFACDNSEKWQLTPMSLLIHVL